MWSGIASIQAGFRESCLSCALFFCTAFLPHLYLVSCSAFSPFLLYLLCPKASPVFQLLLPFFSCIYCPSIFNGQEKKLLYSTLLPYTCRLQRSRPTSPGGAVFVLWAWQGTGCQVTLLLEQTCSYRSQRWVIGECHPSLNQQLDFRASVYVFSLLKAWCSNKLSSCNSEMGRGKWHHQYFCLSTPPVWSSK